MEPADVEGLWRPSQAEQEGLFEVERGITPTHNVNEYGLTLMRTTAHKEKQL